MANPNKGYRQRKHLHISSTKPTLIKYITAFAEWAKGCKATCKECCADVTNPEIEVHGNSVKASYLCECGNTFKKIATESEIRRRYTEV